MGEINKLVQNPLSSPCNSITKIDYMYICLLSTSMIELVVMNGQALAFTHIRVVFITLIENNHPHMYSRIHNYANKRAYNY